MKLFHKINRTLSPFISWLLKKTAAGADYSIKYCRTITLGRSMKSWEEPRIFLYGILWLLLVLLLWAAFAEIDRVVRVEGKVIPAGRSEQIQHLEGGIIASINTTEGALVKKGDLLLTVDDTMAGANLGEANIKLYSLSARAARLQAETEDQKVLTFSDDLKDSDVTKAEQSLFAARRTKIDQEIAIHQNAIKQHQADINEATQRQQRLTQENATAQKRLKLEQDMAAKGAASTMEVLEAQSRAQRLETELSETEGAIPKLNAEIEEEQARIEATHSAFQAQAHDDLVSTLAEVSRLKQTIATASDRLKRTEIRAPSDGVINRIAVNTVGGVIKPGESLIELIPETNRILIEAKAMPRDRGYLRSGLPAEVRISAFDAGELGLLKGQVTQVGADSLQDNRSEPFYQVNILIDSVPASYVGHPIVPGMTITADIVTGKRTILAYLLSPIRKFTYTIFRDPK